jgi:hypothetical protein
MMAAVCVGRLEHLAALLASAVGCFTIACGLFRAEEAGANGRAGREHRTLVELGVAANIRLRFAECGKACGEARFGIANRRQSGRECGFSPLDADGVDYGRRAVIDRFDGGGGCKVRRAPGDFSGRSVGAAGGRCQRESHEDGR